MVRARFGAHLASSSDFAPGSVESEQFILLDPTSSAG